MGELLSFQEKQSDKLAKEIVSLVIEEVLKQSAEELKWNNWIFANENRIPKH